MRSGIVCLCTLAALSFAPASFAGHHGRGCNCGSHGHGPIVSHFGVRHCDNCDDAPVVAGGLGGGCGCDSCGGGCESSCGPVCGSNCHRGGLICHVFGWLKSCGHCSGCGPKYIPEWHDRPCEPCNNCGDWVGPSIHRGRAFYGQPRSGSNIGAMGTMIEEGVEFESAPTYVEPKHAPQKTVQPETSVRRLKQTSFAAPFTSQSGPRHFRAAAQPTRTMRVQTSQPRMTARPFNGVVID